VTPEDEQELRRLIAEADRIKHLIASYMAHVNRHLETAPQLRRAAAAYTRGEATAL